MIRVNVDTKATERSLLAIAKQIPFAMSKTISGVLYQGQKEIRQGLGQHFTVRRRSFIEQSIKVKPATKATLVGEIGVPPRPNSAIDQALAAQERGGERPNPNGSHVAVPVAARPSKTDITPPSKWPGKLKRSFKVTAAGGAELILQRTGRRGRKRRTVDVHEAATRAAGQRAPDPNLKVMYRLEQHVRIQPLWNFERTVLDVVRRDFHARFGHELANAIRTAR